LCKKEVGPAFKDVAATYPGNKEAEGKLAATLKESEGLPTRVKASDAELSTLLEYRLSEK